MKKFFALTSVLALAACGSVISQEEIAKHDADFAQCERIVTTAKHLVYKCPSDLEWIQDAKKQEPNALFQNGKGLDSEWWEDANADAEHTLVEVVHGIYGRGCKEDFHYRTVIRPINMSTKEMYAFIGCK